MVPTHTSFGSGWKHAFTNRQRILPEGFAAIPDDMGPIVEDIEIQIGAEAYDSMTDYKHYKGHGIYNTKQNSLQHVSKMTIKNILYMGPSRHDYRPCDKFVTIADYCLKIATQVLLT